MNGDRKKVSDIVTLMNKSKISSDTEVVVSPSVLYVQWVADHIRKDVSVAVQNCHYEKSGAFTGENSAEMALDIGCGWAVLGHSERRHVFGEGDDVVGKKVKHCQTTSIGVIACVGELLEEREAGKTLDVVSRQMEAIAANVSDWSKVVIAYEPVWAIGTGKVASPQQAQEVHEQVRFWLENNVNHQVAESTRILYGGSVNGVNCGELAKLPDVDGFLVGGAALKPEFIQIINAREDQKHAHCHGMRCYPCIDGRHA